MTTDDAINDAVVALETTGLTKAEAGKLLAVRGLALLVVHSHPFDALAAIEGMRDALLKNAGGVQ